MLIKKQLIKKHQLGGPIARLSQTKPSGSWGNRGEGNELQSAAENATSWVWDKVSNAGDYLDQGLAYITGLLPGGMSAKEAVEDTKNKQEAFNMGEPGYVNYSGEYEYFPQMGAPKYIPGLKVKPTKEINDIFKKWSKAYNSYYANKTYYAKNGKLDLFENSKSAELFKKLSQKLKTLVEKANKDNNEGTILLKTRRNAKQGEVSLSKTITTNGMKTRNDAQAALTKKGKSGYNSTQAYATGDNRAFNGISRQLRGALDELDKIISNSSKELSYKMAVTKDKLSTTTDPNQIKQLKQTLRQRRQDFLDKHPSYTKRFSNILNLL